MRYTYDGEISEISMCHCKQCQKAQGTAFVAVGPIESAKFKIVSGGELLKEFRATPKKARVFCGNCGSPLYSALDDKPDVKRLRLGTLDTPLDCTNKFHKYVDFKANWETISDNYKQYGGAEK